jgi:toxin FitB
MFRNRILPVTEEIILRRRLMVEAGRQRHHTYSQPDLFIAATASVHGLTIVTRNASEFGCSGVTVFDPWKK